MQEYWAKMDTKDTEIKSSGLNVSYLPQDGNYVLKISLLFRTGATASGSYIDRRKHI